MNTGYVKLHRTWLESPAFGSANLWQVLSWCLLRANHTAHGIRFGGEDIVVQPGTFISGRFAGARECGNMRPSTFWDQVRRLKGLGVLDTKSDNEKSIFTVVNWAKDQSGEAVSDNPVRQPADTDKKESITESTIGLAQSLVTKPAQISALYGVVGRYLGPLGEKHLEDILRRYGDSGRRFGTLCDLAAYLGACAKNMNGRGHSSVRSGAVPIATLASECRPTDLQIYIARKERGA